MTGRYNAVVAVLVVACAAEALGAQAPAACSGPSSRDPAWSPDGTQLAFTSNRTGAYQIWSMRPDGRDLRRLTEGEGDRFYPRYSPDGSRVAFTLMIQGDQRVAWVGSDGGWEVPVTGLEDDAADPTWLPDGRLVFASARGGQHDLWVSTVDGAYARPLLTLPGVEWGPRVSPDGRYVAFHSNRDGDFNVYKVRLDGTGLVRLSDAPGFDGIATWSPDGTRIAFYGRAPRADDSAEALQAAWATAEIKVVDVEGGGERLLTHDAYRDQSPSWSPDGSAIAFTSCRSGNLEVWLMDPGGSAIRRLTHTVVSDGAGPAPANAAESARVEGSEQWPTLAERIERYVEPLVANGDFSGSIGVSRGRSVLADLAFGLADPASARANAPGTRHAVASLSKSFTAMAVMLLVDEGKLSPNDALADHLPDFPNAAEITVYNLLTHTSGIPDINRLPAYGAASLEPQTASSLVELVAPASADARPGGYAYSNSNYNLLALVVERMSGQSYGSFVTDRILRPLGMEATAHAGSPRHLALPPPSAGRIPIGMDDDGPAPPLDWTSKTGNGSIFSTTSDLRNFLHRLFERPLLSPPARDAMLTAHVNGNVGFGWFVGERFERRVVYMNGNTPGVSASMEYYPEEDLAVVALANHDIPLASGITRDVAAMALGLPVERPETHRLYDPPEGLPLDDYVGTYSFGVGFEISREGDSLVSRGAWPRYPSVLVPVAEDVFFHRYWQTPLTFLRGDDGSVVSLEWSGSTAPRREP